VDAFLNQIVWPALGIELGAVHTGMGTRRERSRPRRSPP